MLEYGEYTESRDLKQAIMITVKWWEEVLKKHDGVGRNELVKRSISVGVLQKSPAMCTCVHMAGFVCLILPNNLVNSII